MITRTENGALELCDGCGARMNYSGGSHTVGTWINGKFVPSEPHTVISYCSPTCRTTIRERGIQSTIEDV